MDIQNFIVQRRSSARRNISGESNISSLSNSPTTDSFSSGSSEHLDGFKLSSDYEQAWKEHQSKARAEGITLANGNYITPPTLEQHGSKMEYCNALFLAHESLLRWNQFEEDNKILPVDVIDLKSLEIEEAIEVLTEQISGTTRLERSHIEFIVGGEGRKIGKFTPMKHKLRAAIEKSLDERFVDWSPAGDDRLRAVLEPITVIALTPTTQTQTQTRPLPQVPKQSKFGLQSLKESKVGLQGLSGLNSLKEATTKLRLPHFNKAHGMNGIDENTNIELASSRNDSQFATV